MSGNPVDKIGETISHIGSGIGHTIENIGRNPLPIIAAVAITVATGGLGAGAAAAELAGFTAAETAVAGSAGSMIAAATNAAIANAAIAAVNGGDISKIATSAIIGAVTAGVANGIPASEVIKNVTEGLDPSTAQIITSATGRSVTNAVGAVLQGKDPLTGALSGAVSGALSSALSNDQLADLNKAASNIIGNVAGSTAVAGVTGGNIEKAITNSATYGITNAALSTALNSFNDAKNAYQATADKINPLIDQANQLYKTADEQKAAAEEKNASIDPQLEQAKADYYAAKDNRDTAGMEAAAAKFNDLNAQRNENLAEFNQTNSQLADLKTQIDPLNTLIQQQQTAMIDANTKLDATYGDTSKTLQELTANQAKVDTTVSDLPKYYQDVYNNAVSEGKDGNAAVATALQDYAPIKTVADKQVADLPIQYQAMYQSELLKGVDPNTALSDVQAAKIYDTAAAPAGQQTSDVTGAPAPAATVDGTYHKDPNTGLWSVVGKDPNGNDITLVPLAQGSGAPLVEGAAAGKFDLATNPNDPNSFTATEATTTSDKPGLNYTTDPKTGQITVINPDGSKDVYDSNGNLVTQTSAEGTSTPFNFNNLTSAFKVSIAPPKTTGGTTGGTTAPITSNVPSLSTPAPDIAPLTPGLVKGSAFKFAENPTFNESLNTIQQSMPFDYSSQIFNAADGGSVPATDPTLTPGLAHGNPFKFAHTPHFTEALNQITAPIPTDYTKQIMAAAGGGLIQNYAEGEQVQTPNSPSPTLRPGFLHGHGLQRFAHFQPAQFGQYETKQYAEGGDVEGHNPQFFSEGGLQSLQNTYVKGPGDGTSDSVPAMLANGEFVIPADVVSKLGNGSNDAGADALSQMLVSIRKHAQNHDPKKLPPKSKGALAYLLDAKRKVG